MEREGGEIGFGIFLQCWYKKCGATWSGFSRHVAPCFRGKIFLYIFLLVETSGLAQRRVTLPPALTEISGLTRAPNGEVWALSDSGNPPALYRINVTSGEILERRVLPVRNTDWEDLSCSPDGRLYIGEFGNNRNMRRDLRIYRYDPQNGQIDSILFRYPDQTAFPPVTESARRFDCEAMVWHADSLHLFTKSRFKGDFFTHHYVIPAQPGVYTAVLVDSLYLKNRVVTGAALSPDGQTLALTSYIIGKRLAIFPFTRASIYFLSNFPANRFLQGETRRHRLPKFLLARQFESITWFDTGHWLVANEGNRMQKAAIWRWR